MTEAHARSPPGTTALCWARTVGTPDVGRSTGFAMDLGLRDRVVLITGAGGGTGPAIARAFAAEGVLVALHHRRGGSGSRADVAAAEIVAAGGRALTFEADLASTAAVTAMIERLTEEHGPGGVLVTATSAYRNDRFAELSDEAWASVVGDMLGAAMRSC